MAETEGAGAAEDRGKPNHPYDVRPVITYALRRAAANRRDVFVVALPDQFATTETAPAADRSHWKAGADGTLWAHLGGAGTATYHYERVERVNP